MPIRSNLTDERIELRRSEMSPKQMGRRAFLTSAASTLAAPAIAQTDFTGSTVFEPETQSVARNISSFRSLSWEPYFDTLSNGAILVDISSRALHFWSENGAYDLYPSSVPLSEELQKVVGPDWRPTPSMLRRNPTWPDYVPPGPDNPLGTHALYLSWTYYRIHGTHDTRKIGRKSSNGCIGLYNEHIEDLFNKTTVGTQVLLV